ncbi:Uncharacterized conserved protein YgiB, involved in bioifilm formation, UPF0441/DUF1190 family [Ferrimonas sediminum]|uniref:Uncharacterized conserved protein YgiB, involved in bioifilm formation, UPF0441/DUF1190 family n=1 Tax=Ferrimonas sediminum TaxID=718193 RepID=A0A1G9B110_9GAMM|nr:DUF1190 domain-containing protein [Ferrimonas sediminum]SDK32794.1 Uncharacterized conserved protein YgiB, involved in bioifilm formation, UPF0441/DUF1190 family [Ferrimonas sediminum]
MKRSRSILSPRFKKQLTVPTAAAISVSLTLTGCSPEPMQETAQVYRNVTECIQVNPGQEQLCQSVFGEAQALAEETAPRFNSLADCELEFGAEQCTGGGDFATDLAGDAGTLVDGEQYADNSGGGGWFMPMMYGYMLGNMLSGSRNKYRTAPVYSSKNARSPLNGKLVTGAGDVVGRSGDRVVRTSPNNFTPKKATNVTQRGGFGKMAQVKSAQAAKARSSSRKSSSRGWGG